MRRREFVTLIGAATATWPLKAWAQKASGLPRVGLLAFAQELDGPLFRAFRDEMQKLGQTEGQNYTLEFRLARGEPGRLHRDAAEFAQMPETAKTLQMAALRLVQALGLTEADLDRHVTVALLRPHLRDDARPGLDHRHPHDRAIGEEGLGHAKLPT